MAASGQNSRPPPGRIPWPLSDRVTAENNDPKVNKEGDRRFEVADGDADVFELDGHAPHATKSR